MLTNFLISHITAFRNPNGSEYEWTQIHDKAPANPLKIAIAEVGYIAVIPFAVVETAFSFIKRTTKNSAVHGRDVSRPIV